MTASIQIRICLPQKSCGLEGTPWLGGGDPLLTDKPIPSLILWHFLLAVFHCVQHRPFKLCIHITLWHLLAEWLCLLIPLHCLCFCYLHCFRTQGQWSSWSKNVMHMALMVSLPLCVCVYVCFCVHACMYVYIVHVRIQN